MAREIETLFDLLADAATRQGGRILAVSAEGAPLATYSEAAQHVERCAAGLRGLGVRPGDRVALWFQRGLSEFIAAWAVMRAGAAFVSLPERSTAAQRRHVIADARPSLVLFDRPPPEGVATDGGATRWVLWSDLPRDGEAPPAGEAGSGEGLAALVYTSGSTGFPKGVMVSHRNFLQAVSRISGYLGLTADDRVSALLPLSAPWGVLQWASALGAGASVALPPATRLPAEIARSLRTSHATALAALAITWTQLVDWALDAGERLPFLRTVATSGGALPDRILEAFPKIFPQARIFLTYGLSEAFRTTLVPPDWFERKKGSLGRPCPGVEIVLIGDDGRPVPRGEWGELVHRGDCVTLGYWGRANGTADSPFRPCPAGDPEKAGLRAHYSGDRVREDSDGFLWFGGRRDAQIKTGGYRVSPEEVESAAAGSGLVRQAVAWGMPDPDLGQIIALAFEPSIPAGTEEALRAHLRAVMPSHLLPRRIFAWSAAMPTTAAGKVDRAAVADQSENRR